jgi:TraX protein
VSSNLTASAIALYVSQENLISLHTQIRVFCINIMSQSKLNKPKPIIFLSNSAIEALKWLAICLMLVDHVNTYLLNSASPLMFGMGRIAMPLFVFVLGYNLARPEALQRGVYQRVSIRLVCYGLLASIPYIALNKLSGGWWPANILFTLLMAVVIAWLFDRGGFWSPTLAISVFVFGGALVEFWWPAMSACLFVWAYFRNPKLVFLCGFMLSIASLYFINGNHWALMAILLIYLASHWHIAMPRQAKFFYIFYPLHLSFIWCCKQLML